MRELTDFLGHRQSLARFTTRDLLWLMVGCSVLSAIVAAVLPNVLKEHQTRFLIAVGIAVGVAALAAMIALVRRARLERQAGAVLVVIHTRFQTNDWLWLTLQVGCGTLTLVATVFVITTDGLHAIFRSWVFYWVAFMAVERGFVAVWGRARVLEFCEYGLIYQGQHFIATEEIADCYWGESLPNRLFIHVRGAVRWQIDVEPLQHSRLSRVLAERVPVFRIVTPTPSRSGDG